MSFKPFGETYDFSETPLIEDFPDYLLDPLVQWIHATLARRGLILDLQLNSNYHRVKKEFRHKLQLTFRERFSSEWPDFIREIASDRDLLCNFLAYLLQGYCRSDDADALEDILRQGSSAYTVTKTKTDEDALTSYDLGWYVPKAVQQQAAEALSENDLLLNAWNDCYKIKPNYRRSVSTCADFLEGYLRDQYWHDEKRTPSLSTAIKRLQKDTSLLKFRGDTFVEDKVGLLKLLQGVAQIRGEHQTGTGREPTPAEAEYVLHTTIYIWNLMRDT